MLAVDMFYLGISGDFHAVRGYYLPPEGIPLILSASKAVPDL